VRSLRSPPHKPLCRFFEVGACGGAGNRIPMLVLDSMKADGAAPAGKPNLICQDNGPLQAGQSLSCPSIDHPTEDRGHGHPCLPPAHSATNASRSLPTPTPPSPWPPYSLSFSLPILPAASAYFILTVAHSLYKPLPSAVLISTSISQESKLRLREVKRLPQVTQLLSLCAGGLACSSA
jgi:hypothetical protein